MIHYATLKSSLTSTTMDEPSSYFVHVRNHASRNPTYWASQADSGRSFENQHYVMVANKDETVTLCFHGFPWQVGC